MAFRKREHRENNGPDFNKKSQSVNGIISVAIGVFALALIMAASVLSAKNGDDNAFVYGLMGIATMLFSATGAAFALDGLKEQDVHPGFPLAGISLNAVIFIFMISLYLYGMAAR